QVDIKPMNLKKEPKDVLLKESLNMRENKDSNIVNYLDNYVVGNELWDVVGYLAEGSLADVLTETLLNEGDSNHKFLPLCFFFICQCLQVLDFLHSNHVVQQDIRSYDILFGMDGSVKLDDFGLWTEITPEKNKRTMCAGTPHWMAPEMVKQEPQGAHLVPWRIEMAKGNPPYTFENCIR
ncbi:Serine/threonine-protein kinase PAK 3, partial [Dryobates pubescens]